MVIGRLGSVSEDGVTVVYDANNENMYEMKIPRVPVGTELKRNKNGEWRVVVSQGTPAETANRLRQAEDFYYATRSFLPYADYCYVQSRFPTNCASMFKKDPFFLTNVVRDNSDVPICQAPTIDKAIVLSTFEDRILEMKYMIRYCLEKNEECGHTWMYYEELNKKVKNLLAKNGHPLLSGSVSAYLRYYERDFYFDDYEDVLTSKVGLRATYNRECAIYKSIEYASNLGNPFPLYNPTDEDDMSESQNRAVRNLPTMGGHISILTGGPGTGKTTTLKTIVSKLASQYPDAKIYLLSPTGKAARRIQEVFGEQNVEVSTVHKFLGYGHTLTRRELKIIRNADVVIVDESSMLDLHIFERLTSLLNLERTKLVLVGDVDQLPSIGAGNILSDLIKMGVHTEVLSENYRSLGSIVSNAQKINNGNIFLKEDESFKIIEIPPFLSDYLAGMDQDADIVITPYRIETKEGSSEVINKIVQKRFFPQSFSSDFHVGDNVIMIHTNYKRGYFNGETGVVLSFLPNGDYVVGFGDRELTIKNKKDMALGYAITVHKSQGSEYDSVNICIPKYSDFITRRMLYTAVTRAREKVKIQTDKETLRKVILNNPEELRRTFLSVFPKLDSEQVLVA